MAELASNRTSNATKIGMTDDWDKELEQDIADIIGIAIDHTITSPIFAGQSTPAEAVAGSGGAQVNADGSISGVLRFLTTTTTAVASAGIEFQAGDGRRFKLCATSSELCLYEYDSDDDIWNLIGTLSLGLGRFLALEDVFPGEDPKTYTDKGLFFLRIREDETGVEATDISPTASVEFLSDVGDVPDYPAIPHTDRYLRLDGDFHTFEWVTSEPGQGAHIISELDDVDDDAIPSDSTLQGVLEVMNTGTVPTPVWAYVNQPLVWGYGVSIGLNEEPDLDSISTADPELWNVYDDVYKYVYWGPLNNDGSPGNMTGEIFSGGPFGYDHSTITIPWNLNGLWEATVVVNIQPNGDWPGFMMLTVEELYDPDGTLDFQNQTAYFDNVWYWNVAESQMKHYHFPNSYYTKGHTFNIIKKYGAASPQFALKVKAGLNSLVPVHLVHNIGVTLAIKRLH